MKIQFTKPDEHDAVGMMHLFQQLKSDQHEISFADVTEQNEILQWMNSSDNLLYIARYNQHVIGVMRAIRGAGNTAHSCDITIAVSTEYRQKGVGKSLVTYGLSDIKNHDIRIARAKVFSDNKASLNTLLSIGFSVTGSFIKHHYNEKRDIFVDDIILHKDIV